MKKTPARKKVPAIVSPVDQLRIALGMSGITTNNITCEIILDVQKTMRKMGGAFDLNTATMIEYWIKEKYEKKYRDTNKAEDTAKPK